MISDTILHKYMRHLRYIDQGGIVHIDAVELALRLALDDLAESIPPTLATLSTDHRYATDSAQITRLNDWLAEHAPDTPGNTADAVLAVLNYQRTAKSSLEADLERLQTATNAEVAELRSQLAQLDTDNAAMIRRNRELVAALNIATGVAPAVANPVAVHTNGAAANPAPSAISNQQSPINNSMWTDTNMLNALDDISRDWWIGCAAGRNAWRTVPKPVQLRMVRHILSFGPETGSMKMTDFDAIKPDWMPGSGSHTKTLSLSWQQLNDFTVDLEVTR